MPTVIATLKVKEDKLEEAKTFLKQFAADTLAQESGTTAYSVHQRKDDPTAFVFFEQYESDAAFATHQENLKAAGKHFAGIVAGPPEVIFLDEL